VPNTVVSLAAETNNPQDAGAAAEDPAAADPAATAAAAPTKFQIPGTDLEFDTPEAAAQAFRSMQGRQAALDRKEQELRRQEANPEADRWYNATRGSVQTALAKGATPAEISQAMGFDVGKAFPDLVRSVRATPPWDPNHPWKLSNPERVALQTAVQNAMVEDPTGMKAMQLQTDALASAFEARLAHIAEGVAPILQERAVRQQEERAHTQADNFYRANVGAAAHYLVSQVGEDGRTPLFPTIASSQENGNAFFTWYALQGLDPRDAQQLETAAFAFENPLARQRMRLEVAQAAAATAPSTVTPPTSGRVALPAADMTVGGQGGAPGAGTTPATATQPPRIFGAGRTRTPAEAILGHPVNVMLRRRPA
jgi:hypothetical protein